MSKDTLKIGQLITEPQCKDAIHVAVAPVIAGIGLKPGQHIGFLSDGRVGPTSNNIGIVDPFLKSKVRADESFWMFLYPGSITSLRHDWTHKSFGNPTTLSPKESSLKWLEGFAPTVELSLSELLRHAHAKLQDSEYYHILPFDIPHFLLEERHEFWRHYEIATGEKVYNKDDMFFSCSC